MSEASPHHSRPYRVRKSRQQKSESKDTNTISHPLLHIKYSLEKKNLNKKQSDEQPFRLKKINNPQKLLTEPILAESKVSRSHKILQTMPRIDTENSSLVLSKDMRKKKKSQQNSPRNPHRNHLKFHQISEELPIVKTRKYQNFSEKERLYDHRLIQQTNIHISADAWIAYDNSESKFIRGWKAQMIGPAHNLTKLLLSYAIFRKLEDLKIDPKEMRIMVRIFREKVQQAPAKLLLHDHTVITIYELVFGLILTSNEQAYDHLLVNMGYFLACNHQHQKQHFNHQHFEAHRREPLSSSQYEQMLCSKQICIAKPSHLQHYRNTFLEEMDRCISHLRMSCTGINRLQPYQMQTCALDLCILFNACYEQEWFREMFTAKSRVSPIRYQVGYNYSEDRKIKWANVAQWEEGFEGAVTGWRESKVIHNNSIISFHKQTQIVVVLFESKFHVSSLDLRRVIEWCTTNAKNTKKKVLQEGPTQLGSLKNLQSNNR